MAAARPARRASAWTSRQLLTRIVGIFLVGVIVVVLHFTGVLGRLQQRWFPPAVNWSQDYSVVEHLRRLIEHDGLTSAPKRCLLFVINGNDRPTAQRMQVWRKQSGACAAKGETSRSKPGASLPVLFTLLVDREHHTVRSDRGSPGHFHALGRPPASVTTP